MAMVVASVRALPACPTMSSTTVKPDGDSTELLASMIRLPRKGASDSCTTSSQAASAPSAPTAPGPASRSAPRMERTSSGGVQILCMPPRLPVDRRAAVPGDRRADGGPSPDAGPYAEGTLGAPFWRGRHGRGAGRGTDPGSEAGTGDPH